MLLSNVSLSENAFSDINLLPREFWVEVNPAVSTETWSHITQDSIINNRTQLLASDAASSFSESAISQLAMSDLGLLVTRENWTSIIGSTSNESWSKVSISGTESWSNIVINGTEEWQNIN